MNKLISTIFAASLTLSTFSVYAATTPDNTDDASSIGTAESPQHKLQDKRTDKGPSENTTQKHHKKNKVMKEKETNGGTTKGNQIQPTEPEGAAPAVK